MDTFFKEAPKCSRAGQPCLAALASLMEPFFQEDFGVKQVSDDSAPAMSGDEGRTRADGRGSNGENHPPGQSEFEDASLSLLERLDRRQNRVLQDLDRLNEDIERLVALCQRERQQSAA